jgi:4-amino-4-deoxy-L-arabinose transferase-like glycosyltransferase
VAGPPRETPRDRGDPLRIAALLALLAAVWLEPPGSHLAEPDEARYAEIPREMLQARDFVTPRLNGVPYFEKPPLLYWGNAVSFALFGASPWAARLATRLAGTATTLLIAFAVSRLRGRREGLLAAIFYLAAPFGLVSARMNLTDGVLTLFFTATLLAAFATLRRSAAGRPTAGLAALTGALAAGGFLSKGLIAVVLPGGILLAWAIVTRSLRHVKALLLSPAVPVFFALAVPWLLLAERAHPGFLQFFFVQEHFQRFATPAASRPGPIYYFAGLFLVGFLPGLPFFFRGAREALRRDPVSLFFLVWFSVVLVFFSVSRSKLPPYIFPALPAAAALAARGCRILPTLGLWRAHAVLVMILIAACAAIPDVRSTIAQQRLAPIAIAGAACLLAGAGLALRRPGAASCSAGFAGLGWAGLYFALAFAWPRLPMATDIPDITRVARDAADSSRARVVSYRGYVQGFTWGLRSIVPVADHRGEFEDWWLPERRRREIFWSRDRFWREWSSGRPLVALARVQNRGDFSDARPPARWLACREKYCVVANY